MPGSTGYVAIVGPFRADSDPRQGDRLLLSLVVERGMDAPGCCIVELADPLHAQVESGAAVTVTLDAGSGSHLVFTGEAYASAVTATGQTVRAADGLSKLAAARTQTTYADVTSDFILKDLIDKAGAQAGTVTKGPSLGSYVVHRQPRILHHCGVLAALAGADIWTDRDGRVHCAAPKAGGADHQFKFGETVLAIDLQAVALAADGIEVWGEGAAGSNGADAAHWLATDLTGVSGKASVKAGKPQPDQAGASSLRLNAGALRTGDAAADVAKAWAAAMAGRGVRGRIEVTGAPAVEPGDLIGLDGVPRDHAATRILADGKTLRVRGVRHVLDRTRGLRTTLDVSA